MAVHRDASIHTLNQQVGGLRREAAEGRQLRLQLSSEAAKCEKLRSQVHTSHTSLALHLTDMLPILWLRGSKCLPSDTPKRAKCVAQCRWMQLVQSFRTLSSG